MKVSYRSAQLGLALLGAAALIGAAAPAQAEGSAASPLTSIQGLVTAAADAGAGPATLTIHSAFKDVADVVLTVDANTHFRKAGGEVGPPDEMPPAGAAPLAAKSPSLTWFVGLFARATCDSSHAALDVWLSPPEPLLVNGVVDAASSASDLILAVKGRGTLDLALGPLTAFREDGLPYTGGQIPPGDLVSALYWPAAGGNEALRVDAHSPPPLHFQGVLAAMLTDDGGASVGFTATQGATTMTFLDTSSAVWVDGKPATAADLKSGDYIGVSYRTGSDGSSDALSVVAYTAKPIPHPHGTGGGHHGTGSPKGGSAGSGDPGSSGNSNPNNEGGTGKPALTRPRVAGGLVGSVDATGRTFTVSQGATPLTFAVDANTGFRIKDKPAAFADLQPGQHVYVAYRGAASGNLALKVLIYQPAGQPEPGGTSG